MILHLLIILPLVGSIFILLYPSRVHQIEVELGTNTIDKFRYYLSLFLYRSSEEYTIDYLSSKSKILLIALITSIINLFVSMFLLLDFKKETLFYQFVPSFLNNFTEFLLINEFKGPDFYIGVDGISLFFILLTTIITPICILASWKDIHHNLKSFLVSFLILEVLQIMVFIVLDLLMFYIFFESVLIPLFFIIGI